MKKDRKLKIIKNYLPCKVDENDEIFPNGIFQFNISKVLEDINSGKLKVEKEKINIREWFKKHFHGSINENYIESVDISKPLLQAEICPTKFEIIDGNHRMEKAYRKNIKNLNSFKIRGEQLIKYFIDKCGYEAFVEYWNSKLKLFKEIN